MTNPALRFRFGLRSLLIAVAIIAILLAIYGIPGDGDRWEALALFGNMIGVGLIFVAAIRLVEMFGARE
ncbi:MAG TPA: hypothetical protein VGG64_21115 [Pirellulales bacterium]|jgi:hypothetical protein